MMRRARTGLLAVLLLTALAGGCTSGGARRPCTDESECASGQICENQLCQDVSCTSRLDCPGTSTCLASSKCGPEECLGSLDCGDGKICRDGACFDTASLPDCVDGACEGGKVCNPDSNKCEDCNTTTRRCATGFTCRNGTCESTTTACSNDTPCLASGKVCDLQTHTCVACSATRSCPNTHTCDNGQCKPRPRCQNGQCQAPLVCDTATNYCVANASVPLCGACNVDSECSETGAKCQAFGGGKFCGKQCTGTSGCPSGYGCIQQQCTPLAGRCRDNCVVTPCSGGLTCNPQTGLCMGPKRMCDACTTNDECGGPTDDCIAPTGGGAKFCSQDCDLSHIGAQSCPTGFTCREISPTVKQCVPDGNACVTDPCQGVSCTGTQRCNPATRSCVDCLESSHCPASDQVCQNNTCVTPGACTNDASCAGSPTGSRCCTTTQGMRCAQCCTDQHCGGGTPYCVANLCQSTQDPCASVTCIPPQTCNPATGNCEGGGTGGGISCTSDSACPSGMNCDPQFNFCYWPDGTCQSDGECVPGQTCAVFACAGCTTTGNYCAGGGATGITCLPIPGLDFCIGSLGP